MTERKPTHRQIIFNWLMGDDEFATRPDGYWGGFAEVAKVDQLIAALGLPPPVGSGHSADGNGR